MICIRRYIRIKPGEKINIIQHIDPEAYNSDPILQRDFMPLEISKPVTEKKKGEKKTVKKKATTKKRAK